ncbi:hypothetical protein [Sinorhizobium chiapasense]|uniref:Uncharacterized protein n=1 Tax=Sinorhizobium chiapasense TaxID=501572 RepID=A0ABZ2BAI9_9HYPH
MGQVTARRSGGFVTRLIVATVMLVICAVPAAACPICLSGMKITMGQKLDSAYQAVLAVPLAEPGTFRIVEVIKGKVVGDTINLPSPPPRSSKPYLILRYPLSEQWESQGAIGTEYADWLRQIAVDVHGSPVEKANPLQLGPVRKNLTDAEWVERVATVAVNLESEDPLAAEIAYGEISRAPYSALRTLKGKLDARIISAWIADPQLVARRAGYTLLLGIAGSADDAAALEAIIQKAWSARNADNLSAMLAADIELRGPERVAWIERMYFDDRQRTLPEIEAALLALSVHGGANGVVPRARIVEAYLSFIKVRKPMAGFVAMELADWRAWEATADYVGIIKSKAVKDPAGQFAILSYLHRSPVTAALAGRSFADQPE